MAQTKQQIDIGGPWADAVQRRQRIVRGVGLLVRQYLKIKALRGDFARQTLQGLDLRRRQSEPAEAIRQGDPRWYRIDSLPENPS